MNLAIQARVMASNVEAFKAKAQALSSVTDQAVESRSATILKMLAEQPPGQIALNESQFGRGGLVNFAV